MVPMSEAFFQTGPRLANQFTSDRALVAWLKGTLPADTFRTVEPELTRLGARAVGDLWDLAEAAERSPPEHVPYDPWGRRVDEIRVHPAWDGLAAVAAEEGIVATGYERKYGAYSRVVQFAKLYLYHPSSSFFSCPLAMTDGAARALELYGDEMLRAGAFSHLTSRDPARFWTSGQWMTERTGGSDVSGTSTIAKPLGNGRYALHGTKWFTSATTSQMAMTLARIEGHPEGSRGLSLFYLELRDSSGRLQNIEVHRLKEKLGTKALPTAELSLVGTPATLVGGEGGGVKKISSLFNITRLYNAVCALAATRRALALAADYAEKREAFGRAIARQPLHAETLADLVVEFEGNLALTFHLAHLLGKEECGEATPAESAMLRLLTPVAKLYTAKSCMAITSEAVESFGGAGYVEDTGIPRWLRDAQVFSIWEGTTNVLSLDVLRALARESALAPFVAAVSERLAGVPEELAEEAAAVKAAAGELAEFLKRAGGDEEGLQAGARSLAYAFARVAAGSLLLERAGASRDPRAATLARRWCARGLGALALRPAEYRAGTQDLLDGWAARE